MKIPAIPAETVVMGPFSQSAVSIECERAIRTGTKKKKKKTLIAVMAYSATLPTLQITVQIQHAFNISQAGKGELKWDFPVLRFFGHRRRGGRLAGLPS